MLSKEEFIKTVKNEAKPPSRWVVIKDNGDIWGSDASISNLKSGGGKMFILDAEAIREGDIMDFVSNEFVDLDYIYKKYLQYVE
jgi:hypothetical protein